MSGRMRIVLLVTLAFVRCSSHPGPSLRSKGIAIQPIAFDDPQRLAFVQRELSAFYHCPVYILRETGMPATFLNSTKGERYSADSILHWLSHRKSDSISILLGLTGKDIYIADKDEHGQIKKPLSTYAVWGILGLGYQPGDACVISDARFRETGNDKYEHRLRTIVIHEVGHNIGLPHCKNLHCIMNDANEHISTVDNSGADFCLACQKRIFDLEN
jgi:archaemetzincin